MRFPRPRHWLEFPAGRTSDNAQDYDRFEDAYRKALTKEAQAGMTPRQKAVRGL